MWEVVRKRLAKKMIEKTNNLWNGDNGNGKWIEKGDLIILDWIHTLDRNYCTELTMPNIEPVIEIFFAFVSIEKIITILILETNMTHTIICFEPILIGCIQNVLFVIYELLTHSRYINAKNIPHIRNMSHSYTLLI